MPEDISLPRLWKRLLPLSLDNMLLYGLPKAQLIEITSWLVTAYDFYSWVVKNRNRPSEPASE